MEFSETQIFIAGAIVLIILIYFDRRNFMEKEKLRLAFVNNKTHHVAVNSQTHERSLVIEKRTSDLMREMQANHAMLLQQQFYYQRRYQQQILNNQRNARFLVQIVPGVIAGVAGAIMGGRVGRVMTSMYAGLLSIGNGVADNTSRTRSNDDD